MNTKYYEALGLHKRTQAGERSDAINGRLASEIIHSLEGMLEEDKVYSPCSESKIRGGGADAMTRCAWFRDCVPETARVNACLLSLAYSPPLQRLAHHCLTGAVVAAAGSVCQHETRNFRLRAADSF